LEDLPVQLRTLGTFAASFGVWLGSSAAGEPFKLPFVTKTEKTVSADSTNNKQLVDAVTSKLQDSGAASDAEIEFSAKGGTLTVMGTVSSDTQKNAVLEVVRRVDGVKVVKDGVKVKASTAVPKFSATPAIQPVKATMPVMKPVDNKAANQKMANTILAELQASGTAKNSDLDILAEAGNVTVVGMTGSMEQKQAILEVVRRVDGVTQVKDGVQLKAAAPRPMQNVMPVQAVGPYAMQAPSAVPPAPMMMGNPQIDPVPVGPGGGLDGAAPPLPQNAWPTYAPYNNISRVAYPTAYPYNAFPFIGPYYPFPKVPLGWRKVTLEWEDGHWWLGRKQAPIDYWRVKFGY